MGSEEYTKEINKIVDDAFEKIKFDKKGKIKEDDKKLSSSDLKDEASPEPFTKENIIRKVIELLDIEILPEKKFKIWDKRRNVDYRLKNSQGQKFLLEAKPINAKLFKDKKSGAVKQIKGVFKLAEAKEEYEFGIATDGLRWVFISKDGEVAQELNLREDYLKIKELLTSERKVISPEVEEEITDKFYQWYEALLHGGAYKNHDDERRKISEEDCLVNNIVRAEEEDREQIAQIIMDRLIFIKFLQSKGIIPFNVLGYLSEMEEDILNDKLKELFLHVLNTKEDSRVDIDSKFEDIPYLNGSLFLRSKVESENPDYHIQAEILQRIIDFLNSFKFVHREDLSQKQVLDPKILGYIFERAMTSAERKSTGSYYTPRKITKYISENTIKPSILKRANEILEEKGYKENELLEEINQIYSLRDTTLSEVFQDLTNNLKICDNACGSGAFLLAASNVLLKIYRNINEELGLGNSEVGLRKIILKNNIYGVDINPNAIEIAKLRLWLWLVDAYDPDEIEPLPNLDYNIKEGNSLVGYVDIKQFTEKKVDLNDFINLEKSLSTLLKKRERKINKYKSASGEKSRKFKKEVNQLDKKIKQELDKSLYKELQQETDIEYEEFKELKPFHWGFQFHEIFSDGEDNGFDAIIGNPPYIKEYVNREAFKGIRQSPYYKGKMDIWYFFVCRSIDMLTDDGLLGYIAENNWVTNYGASVMRDKVIEDTKIKNLTDFGDYKVFQDVGNQTMVMIFKRDSETDNYNFDYRELDYDDSVDFNDVLDVLNKKENESAIYLNPKVKRENLLGRTISFHRESIQEVIDRILEESNFKLESDEATNGIHHHHATVSKKRKNKLGEGFEVGDGIFLIDEDEKESLSLTDKELDLIKPEYTSEELHRYYANPDNEHWVIYTDSSFKDESKMEEYPNIKDHLDKFEEVITSDNAPYGLHRARDESFFKGQSIISLRKCSKPTFTYTDFDSYASATFYIINTDRVDMKFLTALLNSKLIEFWLKHEGKMQGNNYQVDKEPLMHLPLLKPSQEQQKTLIELTEEILSVAKSEDYPEDSESVPSIKELEIEIDAIVFDLYDLTEEEVETVLGSLDTSENEKEDIMEKFEEVQKNG